MYNVDPMQLLQMIRGGSNPQQLLMSVLQNNAANNPMSANLLALVQQRDCRGIEQFARNFCQSQGIDFDKEFTAFKKQMGL